MTLGMNGCSSWGDCLYITAALNVIPGSTIQLHKGHQEEWVSKAFDGLANVEFVDSPLERIYVKNKDKTHSSQRVLNELKIDHLTNCIPKVIVTEKEESWAKDFLEKYLNPIVIINDNSGGWDATNYRAHYVRPSIELMQDICYHLTKKGYTPLQFGHSEFHQGAFQ